MQVPYICQNPVCKKSFLAKAGLITQGRGKYCSKTCKYQCTKPYKTLLVRFWEKVLVCEHGRLCVYCCWPWLGARHASGHGLFSRKSEGRWTHISAHTQSWILLNNRPLPAGMMGLHRCHSPACVNPMHIYPGDKIDNARDALEYGSLFHNNHIHGEEVITAKLKEAHIPIIRAMYKQGTSQKAIALQFGVSHSMVSRITLGKSWKHVP